MSDLRSEYFGEQSISGGAPNTGKRKPPSQNLPSRLLPEPLSWDELTKPVDMSDNLLGNRLLERCQGMLDFGPAGCGKSVAALQKQACWAAGLDGFHIAPARPLKIVLLQTEDSTNDFRETLPGILESSEFTPEKLELVRKNLIILQQAAGGRPEVLNCMLTEAAEKYSPDLISVNPLLAFCPGDPARELGNLLYQVIDPVLKKHRIGFLGIHHTPKMNNRDTRGYGAHDYQYLAAGDARVANWPRAMIQIDPVGNGIYCFRAVKRWNRTGWTWDLKPTNERYFRWSKAGIRWEDAMPEEVALAQAAEPYQSLLSVLPAPDQKGISRERLVEAAKAKGIAKNKTTDWLKLLLEDGLVERYEVKTDKNRKGALFRQSLTAADWSFAP